jgi:diguanylate cyclase (GGDEF)-like protein/PAS domain S-box-containing protein
MAAGEDDRDQVVAALEYRLAVAEETLRALLAGGVDAIVMNAEEGEQRVYTLDSEDRPYRRLVERMSEGAALVDADGLVVYANERLASLLGVPLERLLGHPFSDWLDQPERSSFVAQLAAGTNGHSEHTARRVDGASVPVLVGLNTTEGSPGSLRCLTVTDLSEQKARQQQVHRLNAKLTDQLAELHRINRDLEDAQGLLTHRTLHDPLTGLPNRTLFVDRLEQSLADAARTGHPVAVSFIDLDAFKRVNDTLGHTAGDLLLQEVAERLSAVVRPNDTVARFAGDEFLVLMVATSGGLAVALADRLLGALHDPPLRVGSETVTASMGLAVSYEGVTPEQLLREADVAMYHAKRAGRARWELFGSRLRDELRYRRTAEQRLRKALVGDGVRVLYQPVVDLADGRPVGAEALVRLRRSHGSLLVPATFIATAEESGLVLPLGQRVLEQACEQPLRWQRRSGHPWYVSVNVSPRQLAEGDLVAEVTAALAAAALPSDQLRLEITESALLDVGPRVVDILDQLRAMGIRIGVDDFGTGYASMAYVRHLPLDFIKIDQSFVAGMHDDVHDLAMVEATLALSHRLGLESVAEGIETEAQWHQLRDLGCDEGQGFLFAKPTTSELVCAG